MSLCNTQLFLSAALVYEMLYKKVFKLPDIEYSVETMLHSDIIEPSKYEYENDDDYPTHIVFEDGRKFELDRPGRFALNNKIVTIKQIPNFPFQCYFFPSIRMCRAYALHSEGEGSMSFPQ